jgi:hypothetical protein
MNLLGGRQSYLYIDPKIDPMIEMIIVHPLRASASQRLCGKFFTRSTA